MFFFEGGHNTSTESITSLKKELERALAIIKTKRTDIIKYQNEINRLKEYNASQHHNSLTSISNNADKNEKISQLTKENDALKHDVAEFNAKLDQMYQNEENFNNVKENYEMALTQIQYEANINKLRLEEYEALNIDEKLKAIEQYQIEINDLNLKLNTNNAEICNLKQLYVDVCDEKNLNEDSFKKQIKALNLELFEAKKINESLKADSDGSKRSELELAELKALYDEEKTKVVQLQSRLDALNNVQVELAHLKVIHDADKAKLADMQGELDALKSVQNELENLKKY
jgi:hypothetical protein